MKKYKINAFFEKFLKLAGYLLLGMFGLTIILMILSVVYGQEGDLANENSIFQKALLYSVIGLMGLTIVFAFVSWRYRKLDVNTFKKAIIALRDKTNIFDMPANESLSAPILASPFTFDPQNQSLAFKKEKLAWDQIKSVELKLVEYGKTQLDIYYHNEQEQKVFSQQLASSEYKDYLPLFSRFFGGKMDISVSPPRYWSRIPFVRPKP